MAKTKTITVRKRHFDVALAATLKEECIMTEECLIAQAAKKAFRGEVIGVSYSTLTVSGKKAYALPKMARRLIERFEKFAYMAACGSTPESLTKREKTSLAKLRASLPVTFSLGVGIAVR